MNMPKRPPKLCNFPGCGEHQVENSYCEKHWKTVSAKYEKRRETAVKRGYTSRWHKLRKWKLAKNPVCQNCSLKLITTVADIVHHIDKNPKNNKIENLQSLCRYCHDEIHKGDRFVKK